MDDQKQDRLAELEQVKFIAPQAPWEKRKPQIYNKFKEFVKVYAQNVTDQAVLSTLKEMEAKLK